MKKTSILVLLMTALGFMAKAQSPSYCYPTQLFDGMDSITIHYNPFAATDAGDVDFQTFAGPLYAYAYVHFAEYPGGTTFNNGGASGWTGVVIPIDSFIKVSDSNWVWTCPNLRQLFGVTAGLHVDTLSVIPRNAAGDTQANNLTFAVSESPATAGQILTTGPLTSVPSSLLADGTENVAVYYHPKNDTFVYSPATGNGDSIFHNWDTTLFVYSYVNTALTPGPVSYELTPWGSVGTAGLDSMVQIDSNNYVFDIPNLRGDFMAAASALPSGTSIDTLSIIIRNAGGTIQTVNLYIPLVITTSTVSAVANVNANAITASLYPNPTTSGVIVSYSFDQQSNNNTTIRVDNLLGQTVMTQEMGQKQASNVYLSTESLPVGSYLVTVTNGTEQKVLRLSKQ